MAGGESLDNAVGDHLAAYQAHVENAKNYYGRWASGSFIVAAASVGFGIYQIMRNPRHIAKGVAAIGFGVGVAYYGILHLEEYDANRAREQILKDITPKDLEDLADRAA
ncbi:MAG TPA: hypothetical protein VJB90_00910 [Candidatus Nanoarchaeia archaeon]|nr:hypothetical protein [Candidatus Nanoarchaeia archaeon]